MYIDIYIYRYIYMNIYIHIRILSSLSMFLRWRKIQSPRKRREGGGKFWAMREHNDWYVRMYVCMFICKYVCACVCTYLCVYTYACLYTYMYIYSHVCMYWACVNMYTLHIHICQSTSNVWSIICLDKTQLRWISDSIKRFKRRIFSKLRGKCALQNYTEEIRLYNWHGLCVIMNEST